MKCGWTILWSAGAIVLAGVTRVMTSERDGGPALAGARLFLQDWTVSGGALVGSNSTSAVAGLGGVAESTGTDTVLVRDARVSSSGPNGSGDDSRSALVPANQFNVGC